MYDDYLETTGSSLFLVDCSNYEFASYPDSGVCSGGEASQYPTFLDICRYRIKESCLEGSRIFA